MKKQIAEYINILGEFCGKRDITELTTDHLFKKYGIAQADVMVLFGGSILCGGDVLGQAMENKIAQIVRLSDNSEGYGANGKNYVAHVDIPAHILKAFEEVKKEFSNSVRRISNE